MKELIKKILPVSLRRKILGFLNRCWVSFCYLLPVKNRVLFFSVRGENKLLDNAEAVYEAYDGNKIIFAHKLPHSNISKAKAYYYILTSKVIVTDDYCRYMRVVKLREGQSLVQIWHACGAFKSFGLDAHTTLSAEQEIATHSQYSAVCVTADNCRQYFARAFGISEDVCVSTGLPRTDKLVNSPDEMRRECLAKHPELKDKVIYLYCPTFREKDGSYINYDPQIDWDKLSISLGENELFIVRRHPIMNYEILPRKYDNIIDMTDESTLLLTSVSAVIITDYSSVIYDAALLNVPPVFYCPDYKDFDREFYLKFPDDLPGELIEDSGILLETVRNTKDNPPEDKMGKFIENQLSACDGKSTERVVELIKGYMK